MKLARRIGFTASAVVALVAASATPALADSGDTIYGFWPNRIAHATFTSYGDKFTVWDDESDGRAAIAFWQVGSRTGQCVNSNGAGTSKTCNYDFPENTTIVWNLTAQGWANPGCCTAIVGGEQRDKT